MHHTQSFFHICADVRAPTIMTVTPGENSISLEWSPPSEGSPLSYTVTRTGSGVNSSYILSPTARNYTIGGLKSNTAYLGTVEAYSLANNATVSWDAHTLPQGEQCVQISEFGSRCQSVSLSLFVAYSGTLNACRSRRIYVSLSLPTHTVH